jgi:hypothetical protein
MAIKINMMIKIASLTLNNLLRMATVKISPATPRWFWKAVYFEVSAGVQWNLGGFKLRLLKYWREI